jgi:hypothetical protein
MSKQQQHQQQQQQSSSSIAYSCSNDRSVSQEGSGCVSGSKDGSINLKQSCWKRASCRMSDTMGSPPACSACSSQWLCNWSRAQSV